MAFRAPISCRYFGTASRVSEVLTGQTGLEHDNGRRLVSALTSQQICWFRGAEPATE